MSSRIAHFSSDEIDHLSNGFGKMGREYKSSRGSSRNEFMYNSADVEATQNGWDDDDDDDDDELKEEDVWGGQGTTESWEHSYHEKNNATSAFQSMTENGGTTKDRKARKSLLSMELQSVAYTDQKKECIGLGFAVLEAVQNGGKESNGGWAPGFSTRKVKIPSYVGDGAGGSGYGNGWHEQDSGGKRRGVPQSAPVSMAVWPVKCGYGESNGGVDVDYSSDEDDGDNEDDDDGDERGGGRLAPHEIVDREYARSQSTTFSVIEGAGRTLKGMDLRRVRNAVWSRTGFED